MTEKERTIIRSCQLTVALSEMTIREKADRPFGSAQGRQECLCHGLTKQWQLADSKYVLGHGDHRAFVKVILANLQNSRQQAGKFFSAQSFDPNANYRGAGSSG